MERLADGGQNGIAGIGTGISLVPPKHRAVRGYKDSEGITPVLLILQMPQDPYKSTLFPRIITLVCII